jgi:hypothetical protein
MPALVVGVDDAVTLLARLGAHGVTVPQGADEAGDSDTVPA